ncbi:MAG: metal-dependent transcriptional regulator, partial [Bacteroidia bacterium]|nr:metal-dependent transcriptional regulator [Bacteroidia bacterium]
MKSTSAEENYLKAIFKHSEKGNNVSTNTLSQELGTTPASVTDMIKKLSEKNLVEYLPYRGVTLTETG